MKKHFFLFIICIVFLFTKGYSQLEIRVSRVDSAGLFVFLSPNFTYNIVMADLKKEFKNNLAIGADVGVKLKSNWSIDFGFKYYFGGEAHQHVIDSSFKNIVVDGFFITSSGTATTDITFEFRGVSFHLQAGKIIPVTKRYRNSGIWLKAGLGVTQHFMNIKNLENAIPHLMSGKNGPEYKKGYDRLTIGFSLYQFIGYAHFNKRNLFCAYAGVEFFENFAKRQREYDYSLMRKDDSKLFEVMIGFKIGWIIPLYKHDPNAVFYYR